MLNKSKKPDALTCPECGESGFKDRRGLGSHRRAKHGVVGTAASTLAYRQKKESEAQMSAVAKPKKSHHKEAPTEIAAPGKSALVVRKVPEIPEIPAAMLGYAIGRVESLVEQIARDNALPEKEFIRVVAVGFAELTKR